MEDVLNLDKSELKKTDKEIIANNISFFRKKLGLSQTALAKKLQYSNKNISKWELGETTPDIFTLKKLSNIFGISIDTLVNPITNENIVAIKTKSAMPLRWKIYMLSLIDSIIFLIACVDFFVLSSTGYNKFSPYLVFLFILPIIDLSIFIFICIVKKKVNILTLSLFGWLIALCLNIAFLNYSKIYYIYIIALGYQILVPFLANLVNSGKIVKFNKILIKKVKNKDD